MRKFLRLQHTLFALSLLFPAQLASAAEKENTSGNSGLGDEFLGGEPLTASDGSTCSYSVETTDFLVCVREERYSVSGTNAAQIRASLLESHPGDSLGLAATSTSWEIDETGKCSMLVDTVITLPKLNVSSRLEPEVLREWKNFIAALESHEYNHHSISIAGSWREFRKGCPDPRTAVSKIQSEQDEYDRQTQHGTLEGANFYGI